VSEAISCLAESARESLGAAQWQWTVVQRMNMPKITLLVSTAFTVAVANLCSASDQHSLRHLARANGGRVSVTSDSQMPSADLELLASRADVVAQGRIDGRTVMRQPGAPPAITFRDEGGTLKADGLEITVQSNVSPDPPLEVGEEVLVFLMSGPTPLPS
jgi:hypothetical protein